MKPSIRAIVFFGVLIGTVHFSGVAKAQTPQYMVLQRPVHGTYSHMSAPVDIRQLGAARYSYGWFGVAPRRHFSRSFGYRRDYTQWMLR